MRTSEAAPAPQRGLHADSLDGVADIEMALLLEGVYRRFGQDFRGHAPEPLKFRVHALMSKLGLSTISALLEHVLHRPGISATLFRALSGNPPDLFDTPGFHLALRRHLTLLLRSKPLARIWIAGSPSPAEVWSLCILLSDEQLHERTQLFVTASDEDMLASIRDGGLAVADIDCYEQRYRQAGGSHDLSRYCGMEEGRLVLHPELKQRCTWAVYHLSSDASFNEFDLILCRGQLGDFGTDLRRRVLGLFDDSLCHYGLLGIDPLPELDMAPFDTRYRALRPERDLYQRLG